MPDHSANPVCPMGCGNPMRSLACDECYTCDDCYPKLKGKPCCQEVACPHQDVAPVVEPQQADIRPFVPANCCVVSCTSEARYCVRHADELEDNASQAAERRIVEWLRECGGVSQSLDSQRDDLKRKTIFVLADAIERGEHR